MKINKDNQVFYSAQLAIYPELGQIETAAETLRVGPVNMRVLVVLLEKQGQLVTRAELFDQVWTNQIVSDDVLTRSISDLRGLLRKHSELAQLIETVPKKGYRWLPEVSINSPDKPPTNNSKLNQGVDIPSQWKHYLKLVGASLVFLLLLSTSSLWLVEHWFGNEHIRVALIPVQPEREQQQDIASELDDFLKARMLETEGVRFLARSAVESRPQNHFPYLSREFGTHWIIEGRVRAYQNKFRVSMSLVDARSATVTYSLSQDIEDKSGQIERYCNQFISEVSQRLSDD